MTATESDITTTASACARCRACDRCPEHDVPTDLTTRARAMLAELDDNAKRYLVPTFVGADGISGDQWRDTAADDPDEAYFITRDRLEAKGLIDFVDGDEENTDLGDECAYLLTEGAS